MPATAAAGIRTTTLTDCGFSRNHSWYERMNCVDRPAQIHTEGKVPVLPGRLVGRADEIHAGVATKDIDASELALHPIRSGAPGGPVGDVR